MKKSKILYSILFFGICLVPSVGMFFTHQESSSENRTLAEFPSFKTEDGSINFDGFPRQETTSRIILHSVMSWLQPMLW